MNPTSIALGGALVCPQPSGLAGVEVEVLSTGWAATDEAKVETHHEGATRLPLLIGRISHPAGDVYVDAGLGQTTRDGVFPRFPLSTNNLTIPPGAAIAERSSGEVPIVLLTHLHYDHIGGLFDLDTNTVAWTTREEWSTARTSNVAFSAAKLTHAVRWNVVDHDPGEAGQILGVPALDVRGDGSIWYLSTPGHTPGSASVLVLARADTWLFIGDIAWVDGHLDDSRRPWRVSLVVDGRPKQQKAALDWARLYREKCPDLKIVAGHEPKWVENTL